MLARALHIAVLAKLARDERLELRVLVDPVKDGGGREPQRHVLQPRLTQRVRGAREVEQVVDDLEGEAEMVAELLGRDRHLRVELVVREQRRRLLEPLVP